AKTAAERGLRAEAWLLRQILHNLSAGWQCFENERDDLLRETDLLLKRGKEEWHIEEKCLTTERIYWSELEREQAELFPGRYLMAFLVEDDAGSFLLHWSWNPLNDLQGCDRRLEWLWEGRQEGESLRTTWKPDPGLR